MRLGLLPGPAGVGKGAHYDASHLVRARAVRALRAQGLSLRAIRDRLALASVQELHALAAPKSEAHEAPEPLAPLAPLAPSYPCSSWEIVELSDGLVLLVRADRGGARRLADEIYRHYGR